jgi:hypothetical protein
MVDEIISAQQNYQTMNGASQAKPNGYSSAHHQKSFLKKTTLINVRQ